MTAEKNVKMYLVRLASHWFFVKLFFVWFFVSIRTYDDEAQKECPEEHLDEIVWPKTPKDICSHSQPLCIDKNKEITQRCCLPNQTWDIYPTCELTQNKLGSPCPQGLVQKEGICIFIINTAYPPNCPYEETISFEKYIKYIGSELLPVWLPVERDRGEYGEGLFYWTEESQLYKNQYNLFINHPQVGILEKNCLIYYNDTYIEPVLCKENHTAICAYSILSNRRKSFCSQVFDSSCKQSDYSTKSKCFCQKQMKDEQNEIELLIPYQNLLYSDLDGVCNIGLEKKDNLYIWTTSNMSINYTYWSTDSNFGDDYVFGAMSSDGWLLNNEKIEDRCTLVQKSPPNMEDQISLEVLEEDRIAVLVSHPEYWKQNDNDNGPMIFCFTDTYNDSIIERIDTVVSVISVNSLTFSVTKNGPGNYWCEGFLYPDLEVQTSEIYYDMSDNPEFVVLLETTYSQQENPFSNEYILTKYNLLFSNIKSLIPDTEFYPRIYKIMEINENKSKITLNFHITTKANIGLLNSYSHLRNSLTQITDFTLVTLLTTSMCIGTQSTNDKGIIVTWPTIKINEELMRPRESWCLNKNGSVITRKCGGNFIDGASWDDMDENCSSLKEIKPTLILNELLNLNNPTVYLSLVSDVLLNRREELDPVDIDYISEFFKQLAEDKAVDLEIFSHILDAVININKTVLQESQENFNSTDKILQYIPIIVQKSNFSGHVTNSSISIVSFALNNINSNSVFWKQRENDAIVEFQNVTENSDTDNFDTGIIFDKVLLQEVASTENSGIIIIAYFKGSLFNEEYLERSPSTIFTIILSPNLDVSNLDTITAIYNGPYDADSYSCSYWKNHIGITKGYWYHNSKSMSIDSKIICDFKNFTNVGLVPIVNITMLIEELTEEYSCSESLTRIFRLLDVYSEQFRTVDIFLISKIIARCYNEIEMVANILDQIMDFSYTFLQLVENTYSIKLLKIFDSIFQNYSQEKVLVQKNFAVFIRNSTITSQVGVEMCESFCDIKAIDSDANKDNFEVTLSLDGTFTRGTKSELFIFTLFSNNVLFEKQLYYKEKESSKIIGLHTFPTIGSKAIRVVYKLGPGAHNQTCEYWTLNYWDPMEPPFKVGDGYGCRFWTLGYYSLRYNNIDLPATIEDIIIGNLSTIDILRHFTNITQTYKSIFTSYDINLIATFLMDLKEVDEEIFAEHGKIVHNIMNFERELLRQSAKEYCSTNKLIKSITNLAQKLESAQKFCSTNLIVMVNLLEEQDFTGMEQMDQEPCSYQFITEEFIEMNKSGMVIGANLISELNCILDAKPKLIMTVFFSDALFNEDSSKKNTNIVFGLNISGCNTNFSKDIVVYYKLENAPRFLGCVYWGPPNTKNLQEGSWELRSPISSNFSCDYSRQGFYTLWMEDENKINITDILVNIYYSHKSFERQLEQLEGVSTFYRNFTAVDVSISSQILMQIKELTSTIATILIQIGINYFQISNIIKQESQIRFNVTHWVLDFLLQYAPSLTPNVQYGIKSYFQIITCDIDASSKIVTITRDSLYCSMRTDIVSYVQVHHQQLPNYTVLTVSVFSENNLFIDKQGTATSKIVAISLSDATITTGSVSLNFNQREIGEQRYSCAVWEFVPNEPGKWIYSITHIGNEETVCTISVFKNSQYIALVDQNVHDMLKDILESGETYSIKIVATLNCILTFYTEFKPKNIDQVYEILRNGDLGNKDDLQIVSGIINKLMDVDREVLTKAQQSYNATENLLASIDSLLISFSDDVEILNYTNFALVIKSDICGVIFDQTDDSSYTIKSILSKDSDSESSSSGTTLKIDNSFRKELDKNSSKIYISVFFNDALFNGRDVTNHNGIIVGIEEIGQSLSSPRTYFENYENQTNICAYWNHKTVNNQDVGYWETLSQEPCENRVDVRYFALLEEYNVTSDLQDILQSNEPLNKKLEEVTDILENKTEHLAPIDIFLISKILGQLLNNENTTINDVHLTCQIISSLFDVNRTILEESQHKYGATDSLLFTTDEVLKNYQDSIAEPVVYKNFMAAKTNVKDRNITGVLLNNCTEYTCDVSFLFNQNTSAIASKENFQIALIFSTELLEQIQQYQDPVNLILTVFFRDNLFNEKSRRHVNPSQVLGILLQGLNTTLQGNISILYHHVDSGFYDNSSCAFWKYQVNDIPIDGSWNEDVTPKLYNKSMICEHDHLTHFVLLLASSGSIIEDINESHILDIITNINSVLSLLGLFGILLTTVLFDRWRNNTGNQILINFSVAISIKNVMLYISEGIYMEAETSMACTITGGVLHYSILSEFCWMLIIAILQFKRFVEVLGGPLKYVLLKACICGWVFPALPVFLIIIIDVNNYNKSVTGLCYPSGFGLYLGVWLPLLVIISINFVIFVFILYNVFHKKTEYRDQVNHEIIFQWRLAILLFSMLGLTWTFGFLCLILKSSLFAILFCFLATLQGFIMFLFFIVFNKNTRYLYVQWFNSWMYTKGYKDRLN